MTEQVVAQESSGNVTDCHLIVVCNVSTSYEVGGVLCNKDCNDDSNWILGCITNKESNDGKSADQKQP